MGTSVPLAFAARLTQGSLGAAVSRGGQKQVAIVGTIEKRCQQRDRVTGTSREGAYSLMADDSGYAFIQALLGHGSPCSGFEQPALVEKIGHVAALWALRPYLRDIQLLMVRALITASELAMASICARPASSFVAAQDDIGTNEMLTVGVVPFSFAASMGLTTIGVRLVTVHFAVAIL